MRKLVVLLLASGVFFGYGSAIFSVVHDGGGCPHARHHGDEAPAEAP